MSVWSNIDDDAQTTGSTGTLKERLSQEMEMVGTEAGWDVIQRWGTGRATTMMNIPRRPETGDWGNPLYLGYHASRGGIIAAAEPKQLDSDRARLAARSAAAEYR